MKREQLSTGLMDGGKVGAKTANSGIVVAGGGCVMIWAEIV